MFRQHVDVLSFGEIGGVGEMTYHTVRFPRYELRYEGNIALLCPRYEKDDVLIDHQADTLLTGQELLVSLCNLYRAINDLNCKENYIEMIAEWCSSNIHPYAIDTLYDLATDEGYDYEILFMDCKDDKLIKRYKETRRNHPLAAGGRIETAIAEERQRLSFLKKQSDYIIDTSNLLIRDLKKEIQHIFVEDKDYSNFYITLLSFGFKYGIPADADLVFDVRFLPNPYYVDELKHQTGNDKPVYDYVMKSEDAGIFLKQLYDMLVFLIPRYIAEGKNQLVVAIGCTGGKHRSVTITNALYEKMKDLEYSIKAEHRDVDRDGQHKSSQVR